MSLINILKEIVTYTTSAGLDLVKITGTSATTSVAAIASDKTVVLQAKFRQAIPEFIGTVGLPNLGKLSVILNIPEYRENVQVSTTALSSGELATIEFNNQFNDFTNTYRLMATAVVNSQISSVTFKEPAWNLDFEPLNANIQKFRYQTQALSDSVQFQTFTKGGNLYFEMGEVSSHQGTFVFQGPVSGRLADRLSFPVKQVLAILSLTGDKRMKISDAGAMQITVLSGVADYTYIIPVQAK
jgi:hypothetical protein